MSELHFIITITWSVAANSSTRFTIEGTTATSKEETRQQIYRRLRELAITTKGIPEYASIVTDFFALEPNAPLPEGGGKP